MTDETQGQATEPVQTTPVHVQEPAKAEEPQEAAEGPGREPYRAQAIRVDGRNRRVQTDGLEGGFVRVKNGDHAGRVGVFLQTLKHAKDGYPERILFRSRDAENEHIDLAYEDVEDAGDYRGGR